MATQTFEELIAGANKIKDNELPESNTHNLVGDQLLQMTNKMQEESSNTTKAFTDFEADRVKKTTELNISNLYPTNGEGGTNKYDLAGAIALVPTEYRTFVGLKITFINNDTSLIETWVYNGGTFTATTSWSQGGGSGGNKILEWNTDVATTRKQVSQQERKSLLQISYRNADGHEINEQYIGTVFTDIEWVKDENWISFRANTVEDVPKKKSLLYLVDENNKVICQIDCYGNFIHKTPVSCENLTSRNISAGNIKISFEGLKQLKSSLNKSGYITPNIESNYIEYIKEKDTIINTTVYTPGFISPYTIITINNQTDFDNLKNSIIDKLGEGYKTITIIFSDGDFYYENNHLDFELSDYGDISDVSIIVTSNGKTTLIPKGKWYSIEDATEYENNRYVLPFDGDFDYNNMFIDASGNEMSMWDNIIYLNGEDIIKVSDKHYKIKAPGIYENYVPDSAYILMPRTYRNSWAKIEKIEDGYIYYYSEDNITANRVLVVNVKTESGVNVNNGKIYIPFNIPKLYDCSASCFLRTSQKELKNIVISNLKFVGTKRSYGVGIISVYSGLSNSILLRNNKFINHRGEILRCISANLFNGCFCFNNTLENCYEYGLYSASTAVMQYNYLNRVGLLFGSALGCPQGISVTGINSYVTDNTIIDCGGIGIALSCRLEGQNYSIAERNTIKYTDDFYKNPYRLLSSDMGAFYSMGNKIIVRDNIIHTPPAYKDKVNYTYNNYAIFGDNSPYELILYRNVIINLVKNDTYDIHVRNALNLNPTETASTKNFMGFNIITYRYHWVGREELENRCIKALNFNLYSLDINHINYSTEESDYKIYANNVNQDSITVDYNTYNEIVNNTDIDFTDFVKSFFKLV